MIFLPPRGKEKLVSPLEIMPLHYPIIPLWVGYGAGRLGHQFLRK